MRNIKKFEFEPEEPLNESDEEFQKYLDEQGLPNNTVSSNAGSWGKSPLEEIAEQWIMIQKQRAKYHSQLEVSNPFFNLEYPEPNYDIIPSYNPVTGEEKEYWLPALKVLNWDEKLGWFVSPSRPAVWENNELMAKFTLTGYALDFDKHEWDTSNFETGNWGIYGGVNLEETFDFLISPSRGILLLDPKYDKSNRRLCIVEPSPESDVVVCEQGWRAKKAFISEVIGETIDIDTASTLLSIAWNRKINVRGLYENWRDYQNH